MSFVVAPLQVCVHRRDIPVAAVGLALTWALGWIFFASAAAGQAATKLTHAATPSEPQADTAASPLVLPQMVHPGWVAGAEWTVGLAHSVDRSDDAAAMARASAEARLSNSADRAELYVGGSLPWAGALPRPGAASQTMLGNAEVHVRAAFRLPSPGIVGVTLGVVAPTARFDRNGPAQRAALIATSIDPTNQVQFLPGAVAIRPALDVYVRSRSFVFQARQGLDIVIDSGAVVRTRTEGRLLAHLGWMIGEHLELSLEGTESYALAKDIPDRQRAATTFGPSARLAAGRFDVGLGFVTNTSTPLVTSVERVYATRVSVVAHF